jgi:mono/diheme cytochrome c family protein
MRRLGLLAVAPVLMLTVTLVVRAQNRTVWDGVYTDEQATRGEALYADHCLRCHGANLQGNGELVKPLTGASFKSTWNGVPMGAMFDRVRLSMPQDKPATLTRQEVADLLAFVLQANKFPSGKTELARQTDMLNAITFQSEK